MMTPDQPDIEPRQPESFGAPSAPKQRPSFGKIARELTEDEMQQSGVHKLLATELDRLDTELSAAQVYQERFFSAEVRISGLEAKQKRSKAGEIISMALLAVGGAMISHGLAILRSSTGDPSTGAVVLAGGVIFELVGIYARVMHW